MHGRILFLLVVTGILFIGFTTSDHSRALAETTYEVKSQRVIHSNSGNVNLAEIHIFEQGDQGGTAFIKNEPFNIEVSILSSGVAFQDIPAVKTGRDQVDVVDPAENIAQNSIQATDITMVGASTDKKTYTLQVVPTGEGTRGGLLFKFPVSIRQADSGPVQVKITSSNAGVTPLFLLLGQTGINQQPLPYIPFNIQAEARSESEIHLQWKYDGTFTEGIAIERKSEKSEFETIEEILVDMESDAKELKFLDTGLKPNTEYSYRLFAQNLNGISDYSMNAKATTLPSSDEISEEPLEEPTDETIDKPAEKQVVFWIDQNKYTINGMESEMDTVPILRENRVYIPARYVAEALGLDVQWIGSEQKVILSQEKGLDINLWLGKNYAQVNGEMHYLDVLNSEVVTILDENERILIPVRFVAQNLGGKIEWDGDNQAALLRFEQ